MQKYRKWTDEATGVNPFIIADQKKHNILYNSITIIKSIVITGLFISFLPLIILGLVMPFLSFLNRIMLFLCGMIFTFDDAKFMNNLTKMKNSKIILSNFGSVVDVFYYLFRVPGVRFLIIHENQNDQICFQTVKGLRCLMKILTQRQPFYNFHQNSQKLLTQSSLKKSIAQNTNSPLIIFYQGIRTNGLGTIKMSRKTCQKLYQVEQNYMISKVTYNPRDQLYHNLVRGPLMNIFRSFGSLTFLAVKVRSQITEFSGIHNVNDIKKDVDEFMSTNGSKLLQTEPRDYCGFIEFYKKTQKTNYVFVQ